MDNYKGALQDTRPQAERNCDWQHSDIAGNVLPNWIEKTTWKKYIPREQNGSLSCVGQSCAKAIEVLLGEVESAHPIYRSRNNYPNGGMWIGDAGDICKKIGTTLETLDASQSQHESEMNRDITVNTPTKVLSYIFAQPKDIDSIASAIEASGHCILIFHANGNEWKEKPVYNGKEINFGHAVCGVDYALVNGEKCIIIEDSASRITSIDTLGQRIITEDYLKARCDGALYLLPIMPKIILTLTRNLKIGCVGNDVKTLQYILKIGADGLFGVKTQKAVIEFQKAHGLVPDGCVGKLTCAELNK